VTMPLLALDIGSSSIKAAILNNGKITGPIVRCAFATRYEGPRVEVEAKEIFKALVAAIGGLGSRAKQVEMIALTVMAPSWVAMDHAGKAITPIVTHQDRRSADIAVELEKRVGKQRHLELAGNRPFPGGISSTTWAWFLKNEKSLLKKADLVGHLNTFLHRQLTAARVTDPSNASFMGLYNTLTLNGWNAELIEAVGASEHQLPRVVGAEAIGGAITASAARQFGLTHGTPMLTGCMDGSAAMLLAGNRPGQLVDVCGSTDVLALCTDKPKPHENLLTRAVGVDRRWVSVSTLAAAGSALNWAQEMFFKDMTVGEYRGLIGKLADSGTNGVSRPTGAVEVEFENYLAGSRTDLMQRTASLTGLTLGTRREEVLRAIIESLARSSARRLALLKEVNPVKILPTVILTGGVQGGLEKILHRDWRGKWRFKHEEEATMRGVAKLV
jgi:xylulokinase